MQNRSGRLEKSEAVKRALVLDFDGTITTRDTIAVLASVAIDWQARRGVDLRAVWDRVVDDYMTDLGDHVERYQPQKEERRTLNEEIEYYRGLKVVEERSFARVSSSGLFEGMGKEFWEEAGRQAVERGDVVVRKGFREFVDRLRGRCTWGIVSVNFSDFFIQGVVGASAGSELEDVEIVSNRLDGSGILCWSESGLGRVMATSNDKLDAMKTLLTSWRERWSSDTVGPVYIGDSGTDIECLMEPGVMGVVLSEDGESSLIKTLRQTGVDIVPVGECGENGLRGKTVYWARDFDEILQSPLLHP